MKPQPFEEHQIATILLKVVQILDDLHSQGKVHNDVTIANITISESGEVKLEDSKVVESILQMVPEVDQLSEDDNKVCLLLPSC
jgi:serine/threonine protein kinase